MTKRRRARTSRAKSLVVAVAAVGVLGAAGSASFGGTVSTHTYVIRSGDTVSALAARFGVSAADLVTANHLTNADMIVAGQQLIIPAAASASVPAPAPPTTGPLTGIPTPGAGAPVFPAQLLAHSSRLALLPSFRHWAAVEHVPAGLLEALTWMESGWQTQVVSSTGAIGVGQLEPSTARWISTSLLGLSTPLDPRQPDANIRMSATFLAWMLRQTGGNAATAVGGYYQGLGSIWADGPLPSTRHYVLVVGDLWSAFRSG